MRFQRCVEGATINYGQAVCSEVHRVGLRASKAPGNEWGDLFLSPFVWKRPRKPQPQ